MSYLFIFSLVNYIRGKKKKTYIFVKKPKKVIHKLLHNSESSSSSSSNSNYYNLEDDKEAVLIDNEDKVQVLTTGANMYELTFIQLFNYQYGIEQSNIKCEFEVLLDVNEAMNFIVFAYCESYKMEMNTLAIYDIEVGNIVRKIPINARTSNLRFIYTNYEGFNTFKIVRTSDLKDSLNVKAYKFDKYNSEQQDLDIQSIKI